MLLQKAAIGRAGSPRIRRAAALRARGNVIPAKAESGGPKLVPAALDPAFAGVTVILGGELTCPQVRR
jgi:hypothetical protein